MHQRSFLEATLITRLERYAGNVSGGVAILFSYFQQRFVIIQFSKRRPHRVFTRRRAKCIRLIISSNGIRHDVHIAVYLRRGYQIG